MNINTGKYKIVLGILIAMLLYPLLKPVVKSGVRWYRTVNYYDHIRSQLPELPPVLHSTIPKSTSFNTKVWLHRVDSRERMQLMAQKFKGLEIDIVYDSIHDYFDVGHPPEPSIGLSLEKMLASIPNIKGHYFWLDFKNLSPNNSIQSCARLLTICKQLNIMDNIIVESDKPMLLNAFTENGFYTSYYIPDFDISENNTDTIDKYYKIVKRQLANSKVNALSTYSLNLPFLEKYFPDADMLTWQVVPIKGIDYNTTISYLTRKERIRAVLKSERSKGFR